MIQSIEIGYLATGKSESLCCLRKDGGHTQVTSGTYQVAGDHWV